MGILFQSVTDLACLAGDITGFLRACDNRRDRLPQVLVDRPVRSKFIPDHGENMIIAMRCSKLSIGHGKLGKS